MSIFADDSKKGVKYLAEVAQVKFDDLCLGYATWRTDDAGELMETRYIVRADGSTAASAETKTDSYFTRPGDIWTPCEIPGNAEFIGRYRI